MNIGTNKLNKLKLKAECMGSDEGKSMTYTEIRS